MSKGVVDHTARHVGPVNVTSSHSGALRGAVAKLTLDSLAFFHDDHAEAPEFTVALASARAKVGSDANSVELTNSHGARVEFQCATAEQARAWLSELNSSTALLPLAKSPSRVVLRRALKNGRLQYRSTAPASPTNTLGGGSAAAGGGAAAAFKASQVTLLDDQLTITFVDRSLPEVLVPLRKKTVVRQAASGGEGEFLVDKHCLKSPSVLDMHEWIDAISTAIQRASVNSKRLSSDAATLAMAAANDAGSGDDDDEDSSSSSSGLRRRKNQVTRRRQLHSAIVGAADDGQRRTASTDAHRRLARSQSTQVVETPDVLPSNSTPEHDDGGAGGGGGADDDGSTSSSSSATSRVRSKIKKRESTDVLLEAQLYLRPAPKKQWKPRRAVLSRRYLTLFEPTGTAMTDRFALQHGIVSVQPYDAAAGDDERRHTLVLAADGKRVELAAADDKTMLQWHDAITEACEELRGKAPQELLGATHRFDVAADGSLSVKSRGSMDISGSSGSFGNGNGDDSAAADNGSSAGTGAGGSAGSGGAGGSGGGGGGGIVREGWLNRKGESMFGGVYKKKWAVLDALSLRFFDSEKDAHKSGAAVATRDVIPLAFASVKLTTDKKSGESKYHFDVYSGQKRHEFFCEGEMLRNDWHDAIHGVCRALIAAAAAGGDKRDPVFGVPLALVLDGQRDTHSSLTIPYAVHRILQAFKAHNGAKTERIFRVEPDAAAVEQYRQAFEEHRFEAEPADAHVAAALLKAYLAELPISVFSKSTVNIICDAAALGGGDADATLHRYINIVQRMEEPARALVVAVIDTLGDVCHPDRVEYSKMPADKLAEIFAPLFIGPENSRVREDERVATFVRVLISGARSLSRRLGTAAAASESAPATYLRGINGRPVVHEGWLMKRGRIRTKKRWVILDERALYIFDAPEDKWPPKETLDLAGATASAVDGSRTRFSFRAAVGGKDAETEFEASSGQELEMWLSAVQWKIKLSSGEHAPAADVSKVTHADAKEALRARGNDTCCDCATPAPALCAVDKGVLLCAACADLHKAAMPASEIKSLLELPNGWSPADIHTLKVTGNGRANDRFEANLAPRDKPTTPDAAFVRRKWLERLYALSESAQALLAACEQLAPLRALLEKLMQDDAFVQQATALLAKHEAADLAAATATSEPPLPPQE